MKPIEISFYQLTTSSLEKTLPPLLEKVYEKNLRALVVLDSPERVQSLDYTLWTYTQGSFLPHARQGDPMDNPIWLSTERLNANQAQVLVVTTGEIVSDFNGFERCIDIFDGNEEQSLGRAQGRLSQYLKEGHTAKYWEQTLDGKWKSKN